MTMKNKATESGAIKPRAIRVKEILTSSWELGDEGFQCQHEFVDVTPYVDWEEVVWQVECPDCEIDDISIDSLITNYKEYDDEDI